MSEGIEGISKEELEADAVSLPAAPDPFDLHSLRIERSWMATPAPQGPWWSKLRSYSGGIKSRAGQSPGSTRGVNTLAARLRKWLALQRVQHCRLIGNGEFRRSANERYGAPSTAP